MMVGESGSEHQGLQRFGRLPCLRGISLRASRSPCVVLSWLTTAALSTGTEPEMDMNKQTWGSSSTAYQPVGYLSLVEMRPEAVPSCLILVTPPAPRVSRG
jgi:hypothetical protein